MCLKGNKGDVFFPEDIACVFLVEMNVTLSSGNVHVQISDVWEAYRVDLNCRLAPRETRAEFTAVLKYWKSKVRSVRSALIV